MDKVKNYVSAVLCMAIFVVIIDEYSQVGGLTALDVVEAFIWSWVVFPLVVISVYLMLIKKNK